jgi:DNA-binding NtrC family response regulator
MSNAVETKNVVKNAAGPKASEGPVQDRILIVDDDKMVGESLGEFLRHESYTVEAVASVEAALIKMIGTPYSLVITDVNLPKTGGFELLKIIRDQYPEIVTVVVTGYGTIESAVEAIKMGAYDYLTKPLSDDEIRLVVQRGLKQQGLLKENRTLKKQLEQRYGLDNVVGHDYKMLKLFELVESVADSKTTVLITGESGTGKSLIARAIHHRSDRQGKPFIEVSCGAIPEGLLESELFGHAKGSFTGAVADKDGKFKAAEGGTIFLDEINSASPGLQVKLLRVLQERRYEPVGSNKTVQADVRVILASNVDLKREVDAGRFRQDLYYRVNVVSLHMPPLVERLGDIQLLAEHFLHKHRTDQKKEIIGLTVETISALQRYHWPGNVRELENAMERAVVLCKSRHICPDDLPPNILEEIAKPGAGGSGAANGGWFTLHQFRPMTLKTAMEEPEKQVIEAALKLNSWNRQTTAEMLDINRTTLYKKMKAFGLDDGKE